MQGPQKTGLLLSALDRAKLSILTERPAAPAGILEPLRAGRNDGPLVGANPQHDQNLLRLLYMLSELSSKPIYREATDVELKWLLNDALPADAPLAPWDEGLAWNVMTDQVIRADGNAARGLARPWMLWDRCFELAPEPSKRFVLGLRPASTEGAVPGRRAGFSIRAFAVAYQRTNDDALLKAIEEMLSRLERQQAEHADSRELSTGHNDSSSSDWLSTAIDCDGAAGRVPTPLAKRLRAVAARADQEFCSLPHDLKGRGGFALAPTQPDGTTDSATTPLWQVGPDGRTTALVAMMCVSRYENTGNIKYRELIHAAADAYRGNLPADDVDAWPMTFGHAISLQLAAWRSTARREYLDRAVKLADAAVQTFWADSPLPRSSSKSQHYESITGSDTLALALVELHLSILHITAVRNPPNTIDR